jgi:predicted ATPase/DNA-binding SARP family transcriptional activator
MQRALLASLVARHPVQISTARISDDLWGDEQPPSAQGTIYAYVSRLRKALGSEVIVKDGDGYRLDLPAEALDVATFAETIDQAADPSTGRADAAASYRAALDLWRGEPYGELGHEPFLLAERVRLVELKATAIEGHVSARLDADSADPSLVVAIETALDEYPLRENLWHWLMLAMYRQGRQADALRSYQRAAKVLGEELGVEPGPQLRTLEEQILLQHPGLQERVRDEQRRASAGNPTNLRGAVTSFIGREDLVAEVVEELVEYRHVTLLGPGGVGKTRLAVEVGTRVMADCPGGVWDIDLLREIDAAVAVPRLAEVLGVRSRSRSDAIARIARHLAGRRAVVLLDNCEHLVDGLADPIAELLDACPEISVLATSQVALGMAGERVLRVPPLAGPPPGASADDVMGVPAAQLFQDRVRLVKPGYRAFGADSIAIGELVGRLDGLPLAIEIAASQAALLPVKDIAGRIAAGTATSLVGSSDDPRHRTLEVLVDWSAGQLSPDLRGRLAETCVFAGPFSVEAARAVWGTVDPDSAGGDLDVLRSRSLLEEVPPVDGSPIRYRALESVRQHGRRRLDAADRWAEVSLRHAAWVEDLVAAAAVHYHDAEQASWFHRLRLERAEIASALRALEGDRQRWGQLVEKLWYWYYVDGNLEEAAGLLQRAIDDEPNAVLVGARALVVATWGETDREGIAGAASLAADLASQLGPDRAPDAALATLLAGDALTTVALMSQAESLLLEAARRFDELGIDWGVGWAKLRLLRVESLGRGRPVEALHAEAIGRLEAAGDSSLLAYSDIILSSRERLRGRYESSLEHGLRALKALDQLGSGSDAAEATHWVINALIQLDRMEEAAARLPELRKLCNASGAWPADSADQLEALMAKRTGDTDLAIEIYEAMLADAEAAREDYMVARVLLEVAEAYHRSGDLDAASEAVRRGRALWEDIENAWYPARFVVIAGEIAVTADRLDEARELLLDAVGRNERVHQYLWLARAHEGLAEVDRRVGDHHSALDHLARASMIRDAIGSHPDRIHRQALHALSERLREALGAAEFDSGWAAASELALDVVQPSLHGQ